MLTFYHNNSKIGTQYLPSCLMICVHKEGKLLIGVQEKGGTQFPSLNFHNVAIVHDNFSNNQL